jgi:hypothetical protein
VPGVATIDDEQRRQLEALLQTHQRRLNHLEKQARLLGLYTPPHVYIEIEDTQVKIAELQEQLGLEITPPHPGSFPDGDLQRVLWR